MAVTNMETNALITVTQNTCVPMKYFDTFLQAGGIISMLESSIKVHCEQRPDETPRQKERKEHREI